MKNLILSIALIFFIATILSGCTSTQPPKTSQAKPVQAKAMPVKVASSEFAKSLDSVLNKGYSILNNKVYITQSKDYSKLYFVGALVTKDGQIYNSIWATNSDVLFGSGLVFSANDFAVESSGLADGRTNNEPISESDDGYTRINEKLLSDWTK